MNENERPELGTTEAAVRSCVNLIALATHTDEDHLAYWLDLYYQQRAAHEKATKPLDYSELIVKKCEEPDPVMEKLRSLEARIDALVKALEPQTVHFEIHPVAEEKPAEEPKAEPAPSSKKRAPMTAGEKRKLQSAQKEKDRITKDSDRDFKRATLWKLMKARNGGLTIGTIVANSEGKLTENTVLDILNAVPRSETDYRALDAALDKCAEIE